MNILYSSSELQEHIKSIKKTGKTIGFVPTMGALHQGHLSLIEAAHYNSDYTICSIFVNPTQFNDLKDLEKYPRTIEKDTKMLESIGCNCVFIPEVSEIYSKEELEKKFSGRTDNSWMGGMKVDFGVLDKVMEGDLDEITSALVAHFYQEKFASVNLPQTVEN